VCLFVCLYVGLCVYCRTTTLEIFDLDSLFFGLKMHPKIQFTFVYQGHRVKVEVTRAKTAHMRIVRLLIWLSCLSVSFTCIPVTRSFYVCLPITRHFPLRNFLFIAL